MIRSAVASTNDPDSTPQASGSLISPLSKPLIDLASRLERCSLAF
jgi:hypothetical protein